MPTVLPFILNNNQIGFKSTNLLNELWDFETNFAINQTSGIGTSFVAFDGGAPFNGSRCLEIDMQSTGISFTDGTGNLSFNPTQTGLYLLQAKIFISSNYTGTLDFRITVFKNNTPTNYDISINPQTTVGVLLDAHNTVMQNISLDAGDIVNIAFTASSSIYPYLFYLDGLCLTLGSNPYDYTPPMYDKLVWQNKKDVITNSQNITANTETKITLTGSITALGVNNLIVTNTHLIRPYRLGAILTVSYSFSIIVPTGTNKIIKIIPKVNNIIFQDGANSIELIESIGERQYVSGSFTFHASQEVMDYGLGLFINSNNAVSLDGKNITITQLRN